MIYPPLPRLVMTVTEHEPTETADGVHDDSEDGLMREEGEDEEIFEDDYMDYDEPASQRVGPRPVIPRSSAIWHLHVMMRA